MWHRNRSRASFSSQADFSPPPSVVGSRLKRVSKLEFNAAVAADRGQTALSIDSAFSGLEATFVGNRVVSPLRSAAPRGRLKPASKLKLAPQALTERGVTLIEMLVVVTIIALFAGVVGIRYFKHVGQAKVVAASQQIELFDGALGLYKLATGAYPTNEQGLAALRVSPGLRGWNGPYIAKDLPVDPWGHAYGYPFPGEHSPDPEIISYGTDGKPGGEGEDADIVSWKVN